MDFEESGPEVARAFTLDMTKLDEVREAADAAIEAFGRVDVVVNNAGYTLVGAVEADNPKQ